MLQQCETRCLHVSAYHQVKLTYSARFHSGGDLDPSNVIPVEALAFFYRSFAEVFKTEASELGLQTRSFDLATFYSYLNGQSAIEDSATAELIFPQTVPPQADSNAHAASLSLNSTAAHSAPGSSSSRAGSSAFVRATQTNAHNPILHPSIDPDGYHITLSNDPDKKENDRGHFSLLDPDASVPEPRFLLVTGSCAPLPRMRTIPS